MMRFVCGAAVGIIVRSKALRESRMVVGLVLDFTTRLFCVGLPSVYFAALFLFACVFIPYELFRIWIWYCLLMTSARVMSCGF